MECSMTSSTALSPHEVLSDADLKEAFHDSAFSVTRSGLE